MAKTYLSSWIPLLTWRSRLSLGTLIIGKYRVFNRAISHNRFFSSQLKNSLHISFLYRKSGKSCKKLMLAETNTEK